jgi:hypothetical protein
LHESFGPPDCVIPATGAQNDAAGGGQILEWVGIFGYQEPIPGARQGLGKGI